MAKIKFHIPETTKQIETKALKTIVRDLNQVLDKTANQITKPIRNLVRESLMRQPEVRSIEDGQLRAEFGLPDGRGRISDIINFWTKGIIIKKRRIQIRNNQLYGGINIDIIRSDYQDIFAEPSANLITEKGQRLPWLEWLLVFGDRVIIRDYEVQFSNVSRSRTGSAIMVKRSDGRWRVPPQFAGNRTNNFVTRALSAIEVPLSKIIETQLNRNL